MTTATATKMLKASGVKLRTAHCRLEPYGDIFAFCDLDEGAQQAEFVQHLEKLVVGFCDAHPWSGPLDIRNMKTLLDVPEVTGTGGSDVGFIGEVFNNHKEHVFFGRSPAKPISLGLSRFVAIVEFKVRDGVDANRAQTQGECMGANILSELAVAAFLYTKTTFFRYSLQRDANGTVYMEEMAYETAPELQRAILEWLERGNQDNIWTAEERERLGRMSIIDEEAQEGEEKGDEAAGPATEHDEGGSAQGGNIRRRRAPPRDTSPGRRGKEPAQQQTSLAEIVRLYDEAYDGPRIEDVDDTLEDYQVRAVKRARVMRQWLREAGRLNPLLARVWAPTVPEN